MEQLIDRDDVKAAIRDGRPSRLAAATKLALERRGILERVVHTPRRSFGARRAQKLWTEWILTGVGEALRVRLQHEERDRIEAERKSMGTVTCPVWAVQMAVRSYSGENSDEWGDALMGALEVLP